MITNFKDEYYFLSNFSYSEFEYDEYTYTNAEAAFHAQKNNCYTYKHMMQFLNPSEAKREGRRTQLRSDWEKVKNQIMYEVVKAKFVQNNQLKKKLLDTGDKILIEGNNWHDNYWGVCRCNRCTNINHNNSNNLGKILMKVREELSNA